MKYNLIITNMESKWLKSYNLIKILKFQLKYLYENSAYDCRLIISFEKWNNTTDLDCINEFYAFARVAGWKLQDELIIHKPGKGGGLFGTHDQTKPHITYRHKKILVFYKNTKRVIKPDIQTDLSLPEYSSLTRSSVNENLEFTNLIKLYSFPYSEIFILNPDDEIVTQLENLPANRNMTARTLAWWMKMIENEKYGK